jgi:hypothetical protein
VGDESRELTQPEARDTVLRLFENARKRKGAPAESDRFLAFLTDPPAPSGRRVADTFAGRFRFVRFMEAVQLEFGICFTNAEWDKGPSLDDFVQLVLTKMKKPEQARRLAEERLKAARMRRTSDPLKFGLLASVLLIGVIFSSSWIFRVLFVLPWALIVGGVIVFVLKDAGYAAKLVARTTKQAD